MPVLGPPMGHPQGPPIQVWGNGGNGPMTTPIPPQHMGYGGGPMPPVPPMMGYPPQQMSDDVEIAQKRKDFETLCQIINAWNANRLDLFALSLPNEVGMTIFYKKLVGGVLK